MRQRLFPLTEKMIESVAHRFRALGEPQRLRILQYLQGGPKSVNEIVQELGTSQPNVSRHLQCLFEAGLVARRRSTTSMIYSVSDPMVFRLCSLVCDSVVETARLGLEEMAAPAGRISGRGEK
jgi:DNA-binding transcriptional ArsR family regulator